MLRSDATAAGSSTWCCIAAAINFTARLTSFCATAHWTHATTSPPGGSLARRTNATSSARRRAARCGGQFNVVLHSGGNQLHGTAYEFLRNGALDARNYFAPGGQPGPAYQRNQFGASAGGPLRRAVQRGAA